MTNKFYLQNLTGYTLHSYKSDKVGKSKKITLISNNFFISIFLCCLSIYCRYAALFPTVCTASKVHHVGSIIQAYRFLMKYMYIIALFTVIIKSILYQKAK